MSTKVKNTEFKKEYVRPDEKTQSIYEKEKKKYPVAVGITIKGKLRFHSALNLIS